MGKETEVLVRLAAEAGAKAAMETLEKERQRDRKSRYDRRLRNTKLLLRNFRMFKEHCENAVFDAAQLDENAIDILDLMWDHGDTDMMVESIKKSAQRTAIIMRHITDMLALYETYCYRSGKPEDARRYRVIDGLYISDRQKSALQLAMEEHVDQRTVYRDVEDATEKLSALIFGIDGLKRE